MAVNVDSGGKEELKTQFVTREGIYRLITLSEYSRPNRVAYTNIQGSTSVRVSFVTLPDPSGNGDRICFNIGRELYIFIYKGVKKVRNAHRFRQIIFLFVALCLRKHYNTIVYNIILQYSWLQYRLLELDPPN